MGKRKPKNNFVKSAPKAITDDDTSDGEEKLFRELRQGRSGAAFIHPQRRQVWAEETPTQQNPTVSSSADTTAAVAESFDADDEQEVDGPLPSTSNVRILEGTIPIPTYHNAYGHYLNKYQEVLVDSDHYPESSPEFLRTGSGYPNNDFRPSYNRCETGRHLTLSEVVIITGITQNITLSIPISTPVNMIVN